jgi:hypothetical protein
MSKKGLIAKKIMVEIAESNSRADEQAEPGNEPLGLGFSSCMSQHISNHKIHNIIHIKIDLEGFINDENIMQFQR